MTLQTTSNPVRWRLSYALLLGLALLCSGSAGLINQVVWQRALKVYLGGSETISSMIVVLVFMAGLGIGSIWMGRRCARAKDPLRVLGAIELLLFVVNSGVCSILSRDLSASVFKFQTLALAIGVPLPLLYAFGALLILIVPCLLMGATLPMAAEACQRRLGFADSRILGLLFFINTFGSVFGTVLSSAHLIAHRGLSVSLYLAAGLNLLAGITAFALAAVVRSTSPGEKPPAAEVLSMQAPAKAQIPRLEATLALGLGFCSLGYEMYLFRLIPLRHQPLPFIFAAVLTGFLLFWSLGAAWSACSSRVSISAALRLCALCCAGSIPMFVLDRRGPMSDPLSMILFVVTRFEYFIPCLFFGYLYSRVTAEAARSWGRDVGRIYAWNTLGSCLGIVLMTLIGCEMPYYAMVLVIALLLYALEEYHQGHTSPPLVPGSARTEARRPSMPRPHAQTRRWMMPAVGAALVVVFSFTVDLSGIMPNLKMYFGRDGVIGIDHQGNMIWDGLWHSKLSQNRDHVGTNNWYLAVCPVFGHSGGPIRDVCVIGVATGITASTLSSLSTVQQVDGYDINRTLNEIYARYPDGTLHLVANSKIRLLWQDARTGLMLNPKKYDVIQAQPLYLKQAGSGLLNSVEFYRLVSSRLKPGGVFCLYANGTAEQAFVVRQTAARAFCHGESFFNGYLLILSNDPIVMDEQRLAQNLNSDDALWQEIREHHETRDAAAIMKLWDQTRLPWGDGRLISSDDHPCVEYPEYLSNKYQALGYDHVLPSPGEVH